MKKTIEKSTNPSFLYQVVERLDTSGGLPLEGQYWVVPTRRAGVFLREALANYYQSTIWAPQIYSIQDFIRSLTEWQFPEPLPLIFELYRIYHSQLTEGGFDETFEQFYSWGEMLLRDFDEVDKYEVDASQLFMNIRDLKEIETQFNLPEEHVESIQRFWKTIYADDNNTPTYIQQRFLYIWEKLADIYKKFRLSLLEQGLAYDGMAYRWVSDQLYSNQLLIDTSQIVFMGFNALSHSEERIIEFLLKKEQAKIFWDVDTAYFRVEKDQDLLVNFMPGKFIHEYHQKWEDLESHLIVHDMANEPKEIFIEGIALSTGQAHYLGNLLQNQQLDQNELRNHAVVLADETMLFPVLNSLPPTIENLNITMGFPLKQTPVYHLLVSMTQLLRNMREEDNTTLFAYHDVLSILGNAYLQTLSPTQTDSVRKNIVKKNLLLISAEYLQEQCDQGILNHIFTPPESPELAIPYLLKVFDLLIEDSQSRNAYLEAEYIFQLYKKFNQFRDILSQFATPLTFYGFSRLFRETMSKARIPFEGEPLSGLQLMGFLETRVLDFEHLYILGANEGNLPDTSTSNSYIPYVLRRGFGLPTYEEKDTIYSYHFFRLLQRSKNIHLIYNTITKDKGGAGEISRFLQQIRYYFRDHKHLNFTERIVHTPVPYQGEKSITIPNDHQVKAYLTSKYVSTDLNKLAPKFLSATALTTYLACPLRFYFKYIAEIKEPEEIEEYMEAGTFGKVLHETLEYLYQKVSDTVNSQVVEELETHLTKTLQEVFTKNALDWERTRGMNYLLKEALIDLVKSILAHDANGLPFQVAHLEENEQFSTHFQLKGKRIRLNGTFDRVDYVPDTQMIHILDYKTGKANIKPSISIEKLFESDSYKEMFQGYFYVWLYKRQYPDHSVKMAFYPLREIQQGRQYISHGNPIADQELHVFEQYLSELIERIFNEPFTQVENEEKCTWCAYKEICNRG